MRTIKVLAAGKYDWIWVCLMAWLYAGLLFLVPFLPDSERDHSGSKGEFGLFGSLGLFTVLLGGAISFHFFRVRGLGAVADDKGVGPLVGGERTWTLQWNDYGGAELIAQKWWQRLLQPEKGGIRILDRRGVTAFALPVGHTFGSMVHSSATNSRDRLAIKLFVRALNDHCPAGCPTIDTAWKPPKRMSIRRSASVLLLGVSCLMAAGWLTTTWLRVMNGDTSSLGFWATRWRAGLITLGSIGGVIAAFAGGIDLYARMRPSYDRALKPLPQPENGPHVIEHRYDLALRGKPFELEDGVRYRVVHPEALRTSLNSSLAQIRGIGWLAGVGATLMVLLFTKEWDLAAVIPCVLTIIMFASIGYWPSRSKPVLKSRLDSLDDTIVKNGDQLVVIKPDGSHLSFGPRARRRKLVFTSPIEELSENGVRYYLDRSRLYESETPLDQEELQT